MSKLTKVLAAISIMLIVVGGTTVVLQRHPKPKYTYAVTELVNPGYGRNEWDLWCWREYANGHIDKSYIGHFAESTLGPTPDRIETSLCTK